MLGAALVSAQAHDESKYPDLKGQWMNPAGLQGLRWDPSAPAGAGQKAPLTPEYEAVFQATLKDRAEPVARIRARQAASRPECRAR